MRQDNECTQQRLRYPTQFSQHVSSSIYCRCAFSAHRQQSTNHVQGFCQLDKPTVCSNVLVPALLWSQHVLLHPLPVRLFRT